MSHQDNVTNVTQSSHVRERYKYSEDVAMVALASWLLGNFHDANSLFDEATRANPNNLEAHTLWADLFLEKYNAADAERSY